MLLTDNLLLSYKRCSRRTFLDIYGDPLEKGAKKDFLIKLQQQSQVQIQEFLNGKSYLQPDASPGDWLARANQTLSFMQLGVEYIRRGVLLVNNFADWGITVDADLGDITLVGVPDILVRQPGKSKFGDWCYSPLNIKLGRRAKPEYRIVSTFQAQLLTTIQGVVPPKVEIILRDHNSSEVNLQSWLPRTQEILGACLEMLLHQQEPEVFMSRQRCSLCSWHGHCYGIARETAHLSLIPGVTPKRYEYLQDIGINDLPGLATLPLEEVGGAFGQEVALLLQQQARSILEQKALPKPLLSTLPGQSIPDAPVELYFDIEAEPERNIDYLFGVLLVNHQTKTEQFYPFLAERIADESLIWQQFLDLVSAYPQAPIFHFSEYEVDAVRRLGQLYGEPSQVVEGIIARFVDLHYYVTKTVTLPVESYSLKSIANWLGFQWRNPEASGDQSVCWYDQWLETGDRSCLEAIVDYNEDDCRATFHLKSWLGDFLAQQPQNHLQIKS